MASATPARFSKWEGSTAPWLPVMPMAVRVAPGIGSPLNPNSSITCRTASIWLSVASAFITISMLFYYLSFPKKYSALRPTDFLNRDGQTTKREILTNRLYVKYLDIKINEQRRIIDRRNGRTRFSRVVESAARS